jgi:glycosyltransferase involved in cell wall biosynthesis
MSMPVFFTIVSRNYLAYALTLMQSLAEQYPDNPRYLCLADSSAGDPALESDLFEVVEIDQLELPHFESFVFRYDIMELNTAVKPYMFAWLSKRHRHAGLVYLDPDILVLRRLEKVESAFASGALAVVTPHLNQPMDDDKFPDELSIMRSGVYNCGFAAINAAHSACATLLDWWAEKLEFGCFVDLERGLFTDQKWIDLVPGMFPDVHILRDNGYNLAYWNLAQRPVITNSDGFTAGGDPLVFVHFSGVALSQPGIFSKHQNRFTAENIGGLRPLYECYLAKLASNGHERHVGKPYFYGFFADGEKIVPPLRRVYRRLFDVHCPLPVPHPRMMDHELFNHPCEELPENVTLPISRVMYEMWCMRADLQATFNLNLGEGRDGYIRWYLATAPSETGMPNRYVEPIRERFLAAHASTSPDLRGEQNDAVTARPFHEVRNDLGKFMLRMLTWGSRRRFLASLYAKLPDSWRMAMRRRAHGYADVPMLATAVKGYITRVPAPDFPRSARSSNTEGSGVNLIGYARGEFGIAENVRSYARALQSSQQPFVIHNFETGVASRQEDHSMEAHFSQSLRYDTNVFFINADQMELARATLGRAAFHGRYNVGFWVWELEHFPMAWDLAFDLIDEVWVPTEFVRSAIKANTGKQVFKIPKAIEFDVPADMGRDHFGLKPDEFIFLYSYDFNSFASRKNPEAAIAAFRRAFPGDRSDVRLLIKSINGHRFPERHAELLQSVADEPRIDVRDGFLSREEMFALQNNIDCYVSLHRAEGFGLGMAECMYLGKPVIATGYSGNMEFMSQDNSCLVDYKLIPLAEGDYPHWQGQHWAEADVGHAVQFMRRIVDDRSYARSIGEEAAASIRRTNSKAACAAALVARLKAISNR